MPSFFQHSKHLIFEIKKKLLHSSSKKASEIEIMYDALFFKYYPTEEL